VDEAKLPSRLRQRMIALIGKHCDIAALQDLASDLRRELHLREVNQHLLKGSRPDRVRVDFDVVRKPIDISVPKFLYHSRQGFTGEVDANTRVGQHNFTLGAVSNGDDLTERFTALSRDTKIQGSVLTASGSASASRTITSSGIWLPVPRWPQSQSRNQWRRGRASIFTGPAATSPPN